MLELEPPRWSYFELRGQAYRKLKRHREAIDDFNAALKLLEEQAPPEKKRTGDHPACCVAEVFFARGESYLSIGQLAQAVADFDRALEWDLLSFGDQVAQVYADGPRELRDVPKAVALVQTTVDTQREHIAKHPGSNVREEIARSLHDLGHLLEKTGSAVEAGKAYREYVTVCEKLREDFPDKAKYKGWLAEGYYHRAQFDDTESERKVADLTKALDLDPGRWSYLDLRGRTRKDIKQYREAIEDFTAALGSLGASKPSQRMEHSREDMGCRAAGICFQRGHTYLELGHLKEAAADFDRAVEWDPWHYRWQVGAVYADGPPGLRNATRAQTLFDLDVAAHREVLQNSAQQSPGDRQKLAWALVNLGRFLHGQRHEDEAENSLLEGVAISESLATELPGERQYKQDLSRAYPEVIRILLQRRKLPEAGGILQRARQLNLDEPQWNGVLSWWLATWPDRQLRDPELSLQLAKHAVEAEPGEPGNWTNLGTAHYRRGNFQEAVAALEKHNKIADRPLVLDPTASAPQRLTRSAILR